jgi:hypothetical protein
VGEVVDDAKEAVEDIATTITSIFDYARTQFFGGADDDFLGAGEAGGDLVGGQGNDTYLFTFGKSGETDIDEAGLDAARELGDFLDFATDDLDFVSGGGGGANDVLELREAGALDGSDLRFFVEGGKDLVIEGDGGEVRIKNMHEEDTRIETLRIVGEDGTQEIDLGAAFADGLFTATWADRAGNTGIDMVDDFEFKHDDADAGLVDLSGYLGEAAEQSATELAFAEALGGWVDNFAEAGSSLPGVGGLIDSAAGVAEDILAFETPVLPELSDYA